VPVGALLRLSLRNLIRGRVRLAVVVALVGLPAFLLLVLQAIAAGVQAQTDHLKRSVDTSLQLRARGSMGHVNMVGSSTLLPPGVLERVRQVPHVARVEPYLLAMTPTEGSNFAMIVGVTPGDPKRLESHGEAGSPRLIAGRDLGPGDRGQPVGVIGQRLARWAGIRAEDLERARLTLDLRRTHPAIFALDRPPRTLRIVGIYASGYVFGDLQLFIPLDTFREIYGVPDEVSWLFVTADSADHLPAVYQALKELVGPVADIVTPVSAAVFESTTTRVVVGLARGGVLLAGGLMTVVVFFVMLWLVRERAWEIGTLKALGAADAGIALGVLAEAVAFCLLGGGAGVAAFGLWGRAAAGRLFALGIGPFLPAHYQDALFATLPVPGVSAALLGVLLAVTLAVAALGSAYGVHQVIRLSPRAAMRHE
jgi:ABC-type lipoprotein release transport system permease subunit